MHATWTVVRVRCAGALPLQHSRAYYSSCQGSVVSFQLSAAKSHLPASHFLPRGSLHTLTGQCEATKASTSPQPEMVLGGSLPTFCTPTWIRRSLPIGCTAAQFLPLLKPASFFSTALTLKSLQQQPYIFICTTSASLELDIQQLSLYFA